MPKVPKLPKMPKIKETLRANFFYKIASSTYHTQYSIFLSDPASSL